MKKYGVFGAIPDGACSNTLHNNFHFSWNSVCRTKQSYTALFGDIQWSGEPTRRHRWHYKIGLFSEATFIFKFEFTAWVVRSSTDAPFIPLQLSWQPNPFYSLRVAHVASLLSWGLRVFSSYHSRRVALSLRYALNTWRFVQGLARRLMRHSHCKPSRAEQNRSEPNQSAWVLRSSTDRGE